MRRAFVLAALSLTLVAGKSDPLAGFVAGPPQRCISVSATDGPNVLDDGTILYRQSGNRTWKTRAVGNCPSLRPLTTLIVEVYGGQLCSNDRFRVLEAGTSIPSAYCRFDAFTPYDRAKGGRR